MATNLGHELRTLPMPSRQIAANNSHDPSSWTSNAAVNNSESHASLRSQFHPGLLSPDRPATEASFLHKLNSVYMAVGLALTLIMTFVTYRLSVLSWQLSQWTAQKDFHELCIELKQVNLTLSEDCKTSLADGLVQPPTFMSKRWLYGLESSMETLDGLFRHSRDWDEDCASFGCGSIHFQKDAMILWDGMDADTQVSLLRSSQNLLPDVDMGIRRDVAGSLPIFPVVSLAFAVWVASFIIKYVASCLHQTLIKCGPKNRGTGLKRLQRVSLSSTENRAIRLSATRSTELAAQIEASETGASLPQPFNGKLLFSASKVGGTVVRQLKQTWSERSGPRSKDGGSSAASASGDDETGTQLRERKAYMAETS